MDPKRLTEIRKRLQDTKFGYDRVDCATYHRDVSELFALIGEPGDGKEKVPGASPPHPDEWHPRAASWHAERCNHEAEAARLRETVARLEKRNVELNGMRQPASLEASAGPAGPAGPPGVGHSY